MSDCGRNQVGGDLARRFKAIRGLECLGDGGGDGGSGFGELIGGIITGLIRGRRTATGRGATGSLANFGGCATGGSAESRAMARPVAQMVSAPSIDSAKTAVAPELSAGGNFPSDVAPQSRP